jgi:hypothetical protein
MTDRRPQQPLPPAERRAAPTPPAPSRALAPGPSAPGFAPRQSAAGRPGRAGIDMPPAPLVWTFDGPFERCVGDLEDTLRRALVGIGDVSRIALQIELSLPALRRRTDAGDRLQPAFDRLLARLAGYGLPHPPRLRRLGTDGPLLTLVVAYRK